MFSFFSQVRDKSRNIKDFCHTKHKILKDGRIVFFPYGKRKAGFVICQGRKTLWHWICGRPLTFWLIYPVLAVLSLLIAYYLGNIIEFGQRINDIYQSIETYLSRFKFLGLGK